jgi:hypothetical protein
MGVYVRTFNDEMALMFTVRLGSELVKTIVTKLNGDSQKSSLLPKWHIKNGTEVWFDDDRVMLIRGWGMLHATGNGGYGLSEEEAVKIQDEFAKYVVDVLNS